jgi:hypothetical protein
MVSLIEDISIYFSLDLATGQVHESGRLVASLALSDGRTDDN